MALNRSILRYWLLHAAGMALVLGVGLCHAQVREFQSSQQAFRVETVVEGLSNPWGMTFLPNGDILVTERSGMLRLVQNGRLLEAPIAGLPDIEEVGQGGLLGIALHPDFARNRWVYLAYAGEENGEHNTEVLRGRLEGSALVDVQTVFTALPKTRGGRHFGSRLVFAPDKTLYASLGDRGASPSLGYEHPSQILSSHTGSLIRINDDGSVPDDNPFLGNRDAQPEIFTYGNRNIQGMTLHPQTNQVWTHEHGPQGGDEINIMRAGVNYGWPVITYGRNYGFGTKIGEGTHKAGMEQPVYTWVPSIAPSGMTFYTGDKLKGWTGDLFVGSLKFGLLVRLDVEGDTITGEERLLKSEYGRIRDVVQGPDGYLYLLTDARNGKLLKITSRP
jgi:glucose/arabinose dehydrogenase